MTDKKQSPESLAAGTDDPASSRAAGPAYSVDRLSLAFESSARRWELIVYPSMFAFIILAAYGFYLVFSLVKDVRYLSISVDSNMTVLASNMQSVSDNMSQLTANIRTMAVSVDSISRDVNTLEPMLTNLSSMDNTMRAITVTTREMSDDMTSINANVTRPMSRLNSFMPW